MIDFKTCPCFKTLLAGLAFGVVYYLSGGLVWTHLFGPETAAHAHLFRATGSPEMATYMPLGSLLIGLAVVYAYRKIYPVLKGDSFKKGMSFGLLLWFIVGLGGGVFWYSLYPVSHTLLMAFLIDKAIAYVIGGGVMAYVLDKLGVTPKTKK